MLSQALSLVLSCALLMPSFPLTDNVRKDITYPFTRTDTVTWSTGMYVEDLGMIDSQVQTTATIGNDVKHEYKIVYEINVECNNVCIVGAHGYSGFNLTSNSGRIFYNARVQKKPSEMHSYTAITNTGTETARHTFNNETADATIALTIPIADGNTITRNVMFPAVSEGMYVRTLEQDMSAFTQFWLEWEAADIEQKTREIEMWIWELTNFRNIPNSSIVTIKQKLENGDVDGAYSDLQTVVNEALNAQNESTNNAFNNNLASQNNFNTSASQEKQISTQTEGQFNTSINQISTSNPVSGLADFANSATWVRDRFDELTTGTAFGTLLGFSLLLGLALAIVGRLL